MKMNLALGHYGLIPQHNNKNTPAKKNTVRRLRRRLVINSLYCLHRERILLTLLQRKGATMPIVYSIEYI